VKYISYSSWNTPGRYRCTFLFIIVVDYVMRISVDTISEKRLLFLEGVHVILQNI